MKHIKFGGEVYSCCGPRRINGKYTCDAFKQKSGKPVKDFKILNALGDLLIHGRGGVVG